MKPDKRIIDLRRFIPDYVPWPSEHMRLTLCAGDGMQRAENEGLLTDIEYFTKGIKGYSRESKPTNIFCCSPSYNPIGIEENIKYMAKHRELEILLVLCDTTNAEQIEKFKLLFNNKLHVIQEDMACYGATLSNDILYDVLVPGGSYILDDFQKIRGYVEDVARFSYIKPVFNQLIITKHIQDVDNQSKKSLKRARGGIKSRKGRRQRHKKTAKN